MREAPSILIISRSNIRHFILFSLHNFYVNCDEIYIKKKLNVKSQEILYFPRLVKYESRLFFNE